MTILWRAASPVLAPAPTPESAAHGAGSRASAAPGAITGVPHALAPPAAAPQATLPTRDMLAKFNRSQSYRAFIYEVGGHPAMGGSEYIGRALAYCKTPVLAKPRADMPDARRAAAYDALAARCDMTNEERDHAFGCRLVFSNISKYREGDALMDLVLKMHEAPERATVRALLQQMIATRDPAILTTVLMANRLLPGEASAHDGEYFAGKWYDGAEAVKLYQAQSLAECELGLDCGAQSTGTLTLCASRGWCADKRAEALRIGLGKNFDEVAKLGHAIVVAVLATDVDAFLAPGA